MQRSKFRFLSLFAVTGLSALVLVGCGSSNQGAEPADPDANVQEEAGSHDTVTDGETPANASAADGEAVFSYGDNMYTAQLESCMLYEGEDALFHGLAYDQSGEEVGYLDGDFGVNDGVAYGEVRIDFGSTGQFQSADTFVAMGDAASNIVVTDSSDTSLIVMGGAWDQAGAELPTATLKVSC